MQCNTHTHNLTPTTFNQPQSQLSRKYVRVFDLIKCGTELIAPTTTTHKHTHTLSCLMLHLLLFLHHLLSPILSPPLHYHRRAEVLAQRPGDHHPGLQARAGAGATKEEEEEWKSVLGLCVRALVHACLCAWKSQWDEELIIDANYPWNRLTHTHRGQDERDRERERASTRESQRGREREPEREGEKIWNNSFAEE